MSLQRRKSYFTPLSNFPLIEFPPQSTQGGSDAPAGGRPRYVCGSDIPRINPGTGFPSGPRIPCRAPGTVKKRRVSVLQRASHIKAPPPWRWCSQRSGAGCLSGTSLSRFPEHAPNNQSHLFLLQMSGRASKDRNNVPQKQTQGPEGGFCGGGIVCYEAAPVPCLKNPMMPGCFLTDPFFMPPPLRFSDCCFCCFCCSSGPDTLWPWHQTPFFFSLFF